MNVASPRVTAIVPVFDGARLLESCVTALLGDDAVDVLLVDDGSRDDSVEVAARIAAGSDGRVRVLALGRNHGFAGAINRGVDAALRGAAAKQPRFTGERPGPGSTSPAAPSALVFVNQDCVVRPGWLEPLRQALDDPRVAVAGARLYEADGVTLQHAGARIEANGLTTHVGRGVREEAFAREASDCDYVCGALMAVRPETWRRLGGFDEGYRPAYFEEADFCAKARGEGMRVVYVPRCEAVHGEASCSSPALFLRRYHRSRLRYVVRRLWTRGGFPGWLRAEAGWLLALRSIAQARPVLAAYLRIPALLGELAVERLRRPRAVAVVRPAQGLR